MFNYREFKKEMVARGHEVTKKGNKITIRPNNNYIEYAGGFASAMEVVDGFEDVLDFYSMEHYNTWIYEATFKVA